MACGFSATGRFAAGVPCTIVVVIGRSSVVVLVVDVKWICVIGCRNLPGHALHMSLMSSLGMVGHFTRMLKVRGGSRGMVTVMEILFSVGGVIVCCLGLRVCDVCEGLLHPPPMLGGQLQTGDGHVPLLQYSVCDGWVSRRVWVMRSRLVIADFPYVGLGRVGSWRGARGRWS